MIKLFITDLDGCLTKPFHSPDWEMISEIRKLNALSSEDPDVPPISICSGRPLPYVEAVAQWLDIRVPVIFENAGLYELSTYNIEVAPVFDEEARREVAELKSWLQSEIVPQYNGIEIEFFKLMDAGLIHVDKQVIDEVYPKVVDHISESFQHFEAHKTDISINIILKENNKRDGIQILCRALDIEPSEVAYIGDSSGDIPGLELVGHPFAPRNAIEPVKEVAEPVDAEVTEAVLEVYRRIIEYNRAIKNEE